MLAGGCCERDPHGTQSPTHASCRKPALERLARHSLFGRYMKAQPRLAGDRRENAADTGFTSVIPRGCLPPPNLRDLRATSLLSVLWWFEKICSQTDLT